MAMSFVILAMLGLAAFLTTVAVFVLDVANALTVRNASTVQAAAGVASVCEAVVLVMLLFLLFMSLRNSTYYGSKKLGATWFPVSLVVVALATTASIAVLIILGKETEDVDILGGDETPYLVGTAVALGFAFAAQLVFFVVYFVGSRTAGGDRAHSLHTPEEGYFTSQMRVKAIPYSQTTASTMEPKEKRSMDYMSPPGSSSGRSAAETMSSVRTSLSQKIRPTNSKTRLLPSGSKIGKRPASLDSIHHGDEGFDSWDTSAVDPQNRQALDTSAPAPSRFLANLETIPASPTVSRSPSPGFPLDLELPKRAARRRSRSYSPVPRPPPTLTSQASLSELHIHPLFRADSPTPAPAATPGTSIIAAPDVARIVSKRSLGRVRSGSLPASSSPLSRQGSYESFKGKTPSPTSDRLFQYSVDPVIEREMTPPLPEWILNAGSRTSLSEYHTRKVHSRHGNQEAGLGIVQ
ncbi:hypothetical protein BJ170DRAFT_333025 [Xylariales sp. AK1849]|nr:hypothetical protein BJ170DRAFT_333025 [Xylariales sp. AK1849]